MLTKLNILFNILTNPSEKQMTVMKDRRGIKGTEGAL